MALLNQKLCKCQRRRAGAHRACVPVPGKAGAPLDVGIQQRIDPLDRMLILISQRSGRTRPTASQWSNGQSEARRRSISAIGDIEFMNTPLISGPVIAVSGQEMARGIA